ncbi:MAG: HAD-IIA family hydrolase [Chloroflexia bacterium]
MATLAGIRALVLDIDGVLYHAGEPIRGGPEALQEIRRRGYSMRFLTNITRRSRATVAARLGAMGYAIAPQEVLTASYLTASYLRLLGHPRCWVLLDGDGIEEFEGVLLCEEDPDYVVLGDLAQSFSYELLNRVLRALWRGAGFIAMQADPYDIGHEGPTVNVGGWLALLERASGRQAILIGKPSRIAFQMALEELAVKPDEAAVVGDRVESDIAGGKNAGLRTVLVQTGHFRPQDLEGPIQPDLVIPSLAELPDHLP